MIRSFIAWWRSQRGDVATLDHVPVRGGNLTAKKLAKARAEAAKRHGKKFHADINHPRETPPSRALEDLQKAQADKDAEIKLERISKVRPMTRSGR